MFDNFDADLIVTFLGLATIGMTIFSSHLLVSAKRLQAKLEIAQFDIGYLLAIEQAHCSKHLELNRASFKQRVRKEVNAEGLTWSGTFNPGRGQPNGSGRVLPTTPAARLAMHTKRSLRMAERAAVCLGKLLLRWLDAAMLTVENGVTKTLVSRFVTVRNAA